MHMILWSQLCHHCNATFFPAVLYVSGGLQYSYTTAALVIMLATDCYLMISITVMHAGLVGWQQ